VKDVTLERGFGEIVKTIDEIERRRERRRKHRSSSSRSLLSPSHSIQSSLSSLSPVHHSQERQRRRRRELESAVTLGIVLEAESQRKEQRGGGGSSEEEDDENSSILSDSSSSSLDDNFISDESSLEGGHTPESTNSLLRGNLSSNPIPSVGEPLDTIHFMTNDTYSDLDEEEVVNSRMSDDEIKRHIRSQLSSMSIKSPSISNHHLHPINRNQPHPTSKTNSNRKSSLEEDSSNDIMKTNDNKKMDDDQEEEIECEVMKGYPTKSSSDQKIEWLKSHLQEERRKFEEEHHKFPFFLSFPIVVHQN